MSPPSKQARFRRLAKRFAETMLLRRLSLRTQEIYQHCFHIFLQDHKKIVVEGATYGDLFSYIHRQGTLLSATQLERMSAAIKFFYERVLGRDKMVFPLAEKTEVRKTTLFLPYTEIRSLLDGIASPGDRMLLFLVYHANLPLNEICTLSKDAEQIFQGHCRMTGHTALAI